MCARERVVLSRRFDGNFLKVFLGYRVLKKSDCSFRFLYNDV